MKTFKEFCESISVDYSCDTYEEANEIAVSLGGTGAHENNGRYRPGFTPDDYYAMLKNIQQKKLVGACE